VFKTDIIKAALTDAIRSKAILTDDCMAVEKLGLTVKVTQGDYENIKITTPSDIFAAEAILRERSVCEV
jgi:2-C-methyl-D-erythritol 4-phosphate cytidylyltransferase